MPSQPNLEFDALLAPIPGDDPAGGPVPFSINQQLEEMRKEIDLESFSDDDPTRPDAAKKADWLGTIKVAQATLRDSSKDLLIAARLTEALVKVHGFPGLRDGLRLLRLLVEQCWERLLPAIEAEDDLEIRAARFNWLDDEDRGARFPGTLRLVPMMGSDREGYGWQHWKDSQGGKSDITAADIERAMQVTSPKQIEETVEALEESWQEYERLTGVLAEKMKTETSNYAPGLGSVRAALDDCRTLARQILQKKGGTTPSLEPTESPPGPELGPRSSQPTSTRMETRAEIYARISEAAAKLRQVEPHSPIPYLLNRAVELGSLPFPDLMKELILNTDVLRMMNRELGIKDES